MQRPQERSRAILGRSVPLTLPGAFSRRPQERSCAIVGRSRPSWAILRRPQEYSWPPEAHCGSHNSGLGPSWGAPSPWPSLWPCGGGRKSVLGPSRASLGCLGPACGGRKGALVFLGPACGGRKSVLGPPWADLGQLGPSCGDNKRTLVLLTPCVAAAVAFFSRLGPISACLGHRASAASALS